MKEGRIGDEGRMNGRCRKEGWKVKEGRKEGRKEGSNERTMEDEGRNDGR